MSVSTSSVCFPSITAMIRDLSDKSEAYSGYTKNEICHVWLLQTTAGRVFGVENGLVAYLTAPSNAWELTSKGEREFHIETPLPTAKVVGNFILNNWGKPAPKPAKPKHVNVGFAGETQVNVREYVRDTSNPMKRVPPRVSKHTPPEVVYARLEEDRKAREARTTQKH